MIKLIKILIITIVMSISISCNNDNVLKIGAILPLTGNSAVWGIPTKEGIELSASLINNKGGIEGKKIEIIFEDTKADPTTATNAVQKLISIDKVISIIDNSNSSVTLAVAPIVEKSKIPLLVTGASSPKIKDAGDYIFRIWNSDDLEGEFMANYVFDSLKMRRIAIIYVNNNYGVGLSNVFSNSFVNRSGMIVSKETFEESSIDFKTQINKVLLHNFDALYLVCYPKQGAILLKQLKELGNNKQILGAVAFEDPTLLENSGNAAEGLLFPLPAPVDSLNSNYIEFKNAFYDKYKKTIPFLAAEGYDGLSVLIISILIGKSSNPEDIKNNLYKIQKYNGVSGLISFDTFGEVHKPFGIRIIKNNKFEWYDK
ncbi:MAG: penicillin-binding protein activator [Bacteroidetes bacterium]|nr:penicillin-binding protein activator [Bacteroidota bacterium]